jgi:hypothetical protein
LNLPLLVLLDHRRVRWVQLRRSGRYYQLVQSVLPNLNRVRLDLWGLLDHLMDRLDQSGRYYQLVQAFRRGLECLGCLAVLVILLDHRRVRSVLLDHQPVQWVQ